MRSNKIHQRAHKLASVVDFTLFSNNITSPNCRDSAANVPCYEVRHQNTRKEVYKTV